LFISIVDEYITFLKRVNVSDFVWLKNCTPTTVAWFDSRPKTEPDISLKNRGNLVAKPASH